MEGIRVFVYGSHPITRCRLTADRTRTSAWRKKGAHAAPLSFTTHIVYLLLLTFVLLVCLACFTGSACFAGMQLALLTLPFGITV